MRKTQKRQSKKLIKNIGGGKESGRSGRSGRTGSRSVSKNEYNQIREILKQKGLYPMPKTADDATKINEYYNSFRAAFIIFYEFNDETINPNNKKTKLFIPYKERSATQYYGKSHTINVLKEFLAENFSKKNNAIHHQSDINTSR